MFPASLEKHHEDQDFPGYPETFGFSLTSLVACLAGSHLHKRQTKHLVQIAGDGYTKPYTVGKSSQFIHDFCVLLIVFYRWM